MPWLSTLRVFFFLSKMPTDNIHWTSLLLQKQMSLVHLLIYGIKIPYSPNWKSPNSQIFSTLYSKMKSMKVWVMLYNPVNYCLRKSLVQRQEEQILWVWGLCYMKKSTIINNYKKIIVPSYTGKKASIDASTGIYV